MSDGISNDQKKNLIFIPYNNIPLSKKILDKNKKDISCIFIEPIQGCLPNVKIKKYLKFIAKYCKEKKIILIFDEMITGLRTNCKSLQSHLKILS